VSKIVSVTIMTLVTPKAVAKHELLFRTYQSRSIWLNGIRQPPNTFSKIIQVPLTGKFDQLRWGERKLTGENLKVVWPSFQL